MKYGQILSWLIIFVFGFYLGSSFSSKKNATESQPQEEQHTLPEESNRRNVDPVKVITNTEQATIDLFENAASSVVFITTKGLQQDYWSRSVYEVPKGSGSGFVWDNQGHIVTNYHVVKGAQSLEVTLADQSIWPAELVGYEARKDLAVLKINAPVDLLKPIPLGSSNDLKVGQSAFAIGNPFGIGQTLTTGIISALGREIESIARIAIRDVIQTDAAINPGNSGGPLLDSSGRLIGINTAIYSPSGASAGIGFSIPADMVNWVVPDLIEYGEVRRPILGVELVAEQYTRRWGVEGAMILDLEPGSPADKAGLQPTKQSQRGNIRYGDIITRVGDKDVGNNEDLVLALENYSPGDTVTIRYVRDEKINDVGVVLGGSF